MSDKFGPCFNGGYALSMAFILLSESLLYSVQFGLEVYDGNWTRNIWTILQLPAIIILFLTTSLLIFGMMAKKYKFILPWLFLGGPTQMVRIRFLFPSLSVFKMIIKEKVSLDYQFRHCRRNFFCESYFSKKMSCLVAVGDIRLNFVCKSLKLNTDLQK